LNEDGKVVNKPDSPTGTESTEDQLSCQGLGLRFNSISSVEDEVITMKKPETRFMFGLDNFRLWFDLAKPHFLRKKKNSEIKKSTTTELAQEGQFPFNKLEIGLFTQNCFFYLFGDERESNRLDTLFSVSILILLYFLVIQNILHSRKNLSKPG